MSYVNKYSFKTIRVPCSYIFHPRGGQAMLHVSQGNPCVQPCRSLAIPIGPARSKRSVDEFIQRYPIRDSHHQG